jgi:oxysterol-binding protein-related protein 8
VANLWVVSHVGNRSSTEEFRDGASEDETVVDAEQGNGMLKPYESPRRSHNANATATVLMHLIKQLRPGADLSRVTLPTFILEPRSMLERITKYVTTFRAWHAVAHHSCQLHGSS